jgi:hypothetical protein
MKVCSEDTICSLCGGGRVDIEYRESRHLFLRTCLQCGNLWYEKPEEEQNPPDPENDPERVSDIEKAEKGEVKGDGD